MTAIWWCTGNGYPDTTPRSNFPILLHLSQWKIQDFGAKNFKTPTGLEEFVGPLADAGVDIFHCLQCRFWQGEFGSDRNLAPWTRKLSGKPTISVGSVAMTGEHIDTLMGQPSNVAGIGVMQEIMERGDFGLIAVGRSLLIDPDWPQKVRAGRLDQLLPWNPDVLKSPS